MAQLLLLTATGALIGWLTNRVAIAMLFRPRRPWRLPLLPIALQGLLPRRRADLARALGEVVERDLLPLDRLVEAWAAAGFGDEVTRAVVAHVSRRVDERLPRFLPAGARAALLKLLEEAVAREAAALLGTVTERIQDRLRQEVRLGSLVEERVLALDLDSLEQLVLRLARSELRHIELLGGVLGGLIGLAQAVFLLLWPRG